MAIVGTTQSIIDWSRFYVGDPKTRNKSIRRLEIGRTSLPTGSRETFYVKNPPTGTVSLYVEPYSYASAATLTGATANSKVFLWLPATLSCQFPDGTNSDPSTRPDQFKPILADYEYNEKIPYSYSDTELIEFLPAAISYLDNTYAVSYSYTGTISTFVSGASSSKDKELICKALAIIVRRSFVEESKSRGLGVKWKGPMQSIDSVQQLKHYETVTKSLESDIKTKVFEDRIEGQDGSVIDIYTENVV